MNKGWQKALVLLAWTVFASSAVQARSLDQVTEEGSLRVAVYRDYAPFSSGPDSDLKGLDVELGAAIAKRLKLKVTYMNLTAGESVDDDLRNAVWKGHYLGGGVADLMLHVPYDHELAQRNDNAVLFSPYFQEQVIVVTNPQQTGGDDLVAAFGEHKVGVELASLADAYLVGAFGGSLRENVVHFHDTAEAINALRRGEVSGVMAPRSEIEGALPPTERRQYHLGPMPMPGLLRSVWPVGMAVKVNAHDLANAIEAQVDAMIKDGAMAKLFARHGLTYTPVARD
jgi:ABC-type amino acid transport substrate-binding protein